MRRQKTMYLRCFQVDDPILLDPVSPVEGKFFANPGIRITKSTQSGVKKFVCRGSTSTTALSVKGPAKDEFRGAIVFSSHPSNPMVDECGLSDTSVPFMRTTLNLV